MPDDGPSSEPSEQDAYSDSADGLSCVSSKIKKLLKQEHQKRPFMHTVMYIYIYIYIYIYMYECMYVYIYCMCTCDWDVANMRNAQGNVCKTVYCLYACDMSLMGFT